MTVMLRKHQTGLSAIRTVIPAEGDGRCRMERTYGMTTAATV